MKQHKVLKELDIKETSGGKPVVFSVKFRTKKGEHIFMPKAIFVPSSSRFPSIEIRI